MLWMYEGWAYHDCFRPHTCRIVVYTAAELYVGFGFRS